MYTSQITTIAFVAMASFIQTCPASIIGDIVDTGVQAATGLALAESGNLPRRSDITDNIDQCIHDGRAQTEHVQFIGERDMIMDGVPPSCMQEVKGWIEHPQARLLAQDYGTISILDETAIKIVGLPEKTVDKIQGAMTKPQ